MYLEHRTFWAAWIKYHHRWIHHQTKTKTTYFTHNVKLFLMFYILRSRSRHRKNMSKSKSKKKKTEAKPNRYGWTLDTVDVTTFVIYRLFNYICCNVSPNKIWKKIHSNDINMCSMAHDFSSSSSSFFRLTNENENEKSWFHFFGNKDIICNTIIPIIHPVCVCFNIYGSWTTYANDGRFGLVKHEVICRAFRGRSSKK